MTAAVRRLSARAAGATLGVRRTPLVAGGFLLGALVGALPPVQILPQRWQCTADGGRWISAVRACDYAGPRTPAVPSDALHDLPLPVPRHQDDR